MRLLKLCAVVLLALGALAPQLRAESAEAILQATGVKGGVVVHLGCGDGRLTAALRANESYIVHGLDADPANIEKARAHIQSLGIYGPVSVVQWTDPARLPYAANIVSLLVAEDLGKVPMDEVMRVLAPLGVAYIGGEKTVKPWPQQMDEWTHFLHGADNNAVAKDTLVGPPQRMQWVADPLWSRGHEMVSSISALVTARGRIFYVVDEGQPGIYSMPSKWFLAARDAFSGVLLWKQPLPDWMQEGAGGGFGKGTHPRCLVADGERLFLPLGEAGVLTALDAATGKTLRTLDAAKGTNEILCGEGLVVAVASGAGGGRRGGGGGGATLIGARSDTLEPLWQAKAPGLVHGTTAIGAKRVLFMAGDDVVALDSKTGAEAWRVAGKSQQDDVLKLQAGRTLIVHGPAAYLLSGRGLSAVSIDTGKTLWNRDASKSRRGELFVADGLLWQVQGTGVVGYDLASGEVRKTVDAPGVYSAGHHPRCYRSKATERFIITQNRGAEFVSLSSQSHTRNDWVRGICGLGIMPANGLLYAPPCQCFCYGGIMLTGFKALAPGPVPQRPASAASDGARLERGPAYEEVRGAAAQPAGTADWPMYRHDSTRLGSTTAEVPAQVRPLWQAAIGGRLTPPVVAGGMLLVAAKDACAVRAFDAADGRALWSFTAGGPIDSPPTMHDGLVLFGAADGWVYCLRAADGRLAWRFRAAPEERLIGAFGRLESAWPVHGSVLILGGAAYATAGRSTYLDGGIHVYALDPRTGRKLHEARLSTTQEPIREGQQSPFLEAFHIEGTRSDILVTDGQFIYMGQIKLDASLAVQPAPYIPDSGEAKPLDLEAAPYVDGGVFRAGLEKKRGTDFPSLGVLRGPMGDRTLGLRVFATGGFLDDTYFNRTYWMYSRVWPGYYIAHLAAKSGQLLVADSKMTYAVEAYPSRNIHSPTFAPGRTGYLLFADDNRNEPVLDPRTRNRDKGMGYTRAAPPLWFQWVPVRIRAMVAAGAALFVSGPPDVAEQGDPYASFEGRKGAVLWAVSAADGKKLAEYPLPAPPVFDGIAAAAGRLYISTTDGKVICLAGGDRR